MPFLASVRSMFSLSGKDRSRSASSKPSMHKGTSSSERIISEPTHIEAGTQEDIRSDGQGRDIEMGQIRLKTRVDVEHHQRDPSWRNLEPAPR